MRKVMTLLCLLLMVLTLTACGSDAHCDEPVITRPPEDHAESVVLEEIQDTQQSENSQEAPEQTEAAAVSGNYTFVTSGVELIPGDPFDPSILPEAESVYEVPSCAIVGTDNLYNYGSFELTAFDDGTNELIYSILLIDPNITTTEGLALGDSLEKVIEIYGDGYTQQNNAYVYTGDAEILYIILQGEHVASIEYRMIVE